MGDKDCRNQACLDWLVKKCRGADHEYNHEASTSNPRPNLKENYFDTGEVYDDGASTSNPRPSLEEYSIDPGEFIDKLYPRLDTNKIVDWNKRNSNTRVNNQFTGEDQQESKHIHIVFLNDWNREGHKMLKTGLSMKLKNLFNDYAEAENKSLRSLRFSYEGKTLFLSSVGKKTPTDLGMENNANIIVTDLTRINNENDAPTEISSNRNNQNMNRNKGKGKQKTRVLPRKQPLVIEKTTEELRIEHSNILSKLHEEAQPQLKLIRQKLNNLLIERNPPKVKSTPHSNNKFPRPAPTVDNSSLEGLCGKAGKSHYAVQVGEFSNLYKTSKRRTPSSHQQKLIKLDLHGFTKEEALDALNESLPQWNDIAMSGSYPFIIPVEIICGCGSQILSEVVEQWIKCTEQVANAPRIRKR